MTTETRICELWACICDRMADVFGAPLPHKMLTLGEKKGWQVTLNATREAQGNHDAFAAHVLWNEFPAGIIDANGGCLAAGAAANEETFRAWLPLAASPAPSPEGEQA